MGSVRQVTVSERIARAVRGAEFYCISAVYLFGSSLRHEMPNDIDILIVYKDDSATSATIAEKQRLLSILSDEFDLLYIDVTALSETELAQTQFVHEAGSSQLVWPIIATTAE